jgi:anti-anti-sigma factor
LRDRRRLFRRGATGKSQAEYQYITYKNVDGVAVVNFLETVSMFDGDKVRDVGKELLDLVDAKRYTKLLLNLTNARFVSSAMLAHLVKLHRRVQEVKGKIRLCCLRPVIMDAFRVSNFDKIFEIFPDEAAALKKF